MTRNKTNKMRILRDAGYEQVCRVQMVRQPQYEKVALARQSGRRIRRARSVQRLVPSPSTSPPQPPTNVPSLNMARVRSILKSPSLPASIFGVGRSLLNRRVTFHGVDDNAGVEQSMEDDSEHSDDAEIADAEISDAFSNENHDDSEDQPLIIFSDNSMNETSIEVTQPEEQNVIDEFDPITGNNEPMASGSGVNAASLLSTLDWSAIQSPSMQNSVRSANENDTNDVSTDSTDSTNQQEPMYPPIRWRIPQLIPIRSYRNARFIRTATATATTPTQSTSPTPSTSTTLPAVVFDSNFGVLRYDSDSD